MAAGGAINSVYENYGSNSDTSRAIFLAVSPNCSAGQLQSALHGSPTFPTIGNDGGGPALLSFYDGYADNYWGCCWLIHPDKTFARMGRGSGSDGYGIETGYQTAQTDTCARDHATQFAINITATNGTIAKSPDKATYDTGSTVQLTATPATGYQFDGWSGDASGTTNPVSVTMNSAKNITAQFSLMPIDTLNPSEELAASASWEAISDGGVSTATLDVTGLATGNGIRADFNVGANDTCWADLGSTFDKDLSGATWVIVSYKANKGMVMSLDDPALSDNGTAYGVNLSPSTAWKTSLFKLNNTVFSQPVGSTASPLNLANVTGISFSPGSLDYNVSPSGLSNIEINRLVVFGKGSLLTSPIITKSAERPISSGVRVSGHSLFVNGMKGAGTVGIYSAAGRLVMNREISGAAPMIDVSNLSVGSYMVRTSFSGSVKTSRIMIGH